MKDFTKKDLLLIINTYQNYMNDFVNVTDKDINNIYLKIAKKDLHATFYGKLDNEMKDDFFNVSDTIISKR
tara:strand:+ start:22395 stop:22607 length:213 start_codon:yes stop_codon:yes gene_type:complete